MQVYAISYDDPEALADFSEAHGIEYPVLADPESKVIKAFGILNTLIPEEEPEYHGVPFPVSYVIDGDGTVLAKFAENNQIFRPGPEKLLRAALGYQVPPQPADLPVSEVSVHAYLDGPYLVPGSLRDLVVEFNVPAGHHLYGEPVAEGLVATTVSFEEDDFFIVRETVHPPTKVHHLSSGEELNVYEGLVQIRTTVTSLGAHGRSFEGDESEFGVGHHVLRGSARFQSCDDHSCAIPQTVSFEVPIEVKPPIIGDFGGPSLRGERMHGGQHMRRLLARGDNSD